MNNWIANLVKYLIEGIVVAVVAYYLTKKTYKVSEIASIGVVAALTFAILDYFSPSIGSSARLGSGFGIGANVVGFAGSNGLTPGFPQLPVLGGAVSHPNEGKVLPGTYNSFEDVEEDVIEEDDMVQNNINANDNFGE